MTGDIDGRHGSSRADTGTGVTFSHPETISIDERFTVEISNLATDTVEIHLSVTDRDGTDWEASATYYVSGETLVPAEESSMDGGVNDGVIGLIQQATPATGADRYTPDRASCDELQIRVTDEGDTLGATTIERTFGDPEVTAREVPGEEFVGTVFEPAAEATAPGVVVLHGSGGTPSYGTAQLLASHGFTTLALQYFDWRGRYDILPTELVEVPLEFVEAATEWLLDHDGVSGSRVGLWGASKGGELALLAGSHLDTVGPVVSVNGSGVVWGGLGQQGASPESSWSRDGEPVTQVPYTDDYTVWDTTPPMEMEPGYSQSYEEADTEAIATATIPVEEIAGPVTLVSGDADSMWDSRTLQGVAADRLRKHDCEYEHLTYEGAGHAITFPYLPTAHRADGQQFEMGGSARGYARADRDHWRETLETFETLQK